MTLIVDCYWLGAVSKVLGSRFFPINVSSRPGKDCPQGLLYLIGNIYNQRREEGLA